MVTKRKRKQENCCGCCGCRCNLDWCKRCAKHIDPRRTFWDATYLAKYGEDCPYQVGKKSECNQ